MKEIFKWAFTEVYIMKQYFKFSTTNYKTILIYFNVLRNIVYSIYVSNIYFQYTKIQQLLPFSYMVKQYIVIHTEISYFKIYE